jgi:hypothetical protein
VHDSRSLIPGEFQQCKRAIAYQPQLGRLRVQDLKTWGGASGHTYTFTRRPEGTTEIDVANSFGVNGANWTVELTAPGAHNLQTML